MAGEGGTHLGKELPSLFPQSQPNTEAKLKENYYGSVPDTLRQGFSSVKSDLSYAYPLEFSERNYRQIRDKGDMLMLRNIQGLHAPLNLRMERHIASQVRRLPCLTSSMVALETLLDLDSTIDFDDFLNDPQDSEVYRKAHAIMEN